jgi:hypothetical protein
MSFGHFKTLKELPIVTTESKVLFQFFDIKNFVGSELEV